MRYIKRSLAAILVLTLLVQLLPVSVFAEEGAPSVTAEESTPATREQPEETSEDVCVVSEVEDLRSQTQKHFRMSDGSYIAVEYGTAVHYEENGQWKDIDNTLSLTPATATASAQYASSNGGSGKRFAQSLSEGFIFSTSSNDLGLTLSLPTGTTATQPGLSLMGEGETAQIEGEATQIEGEATQIEGEATQIEGETTQIEGEITTTIPSSDFNPTAAAQVANASSAAALNTSGEEASLGEQIIPDTLSTQVLYENVYPQVDLLYELYGNNIKESILLKKNTERNSFVFRLTLQGMTPALQSDGSILLSNGTEAVYYIPAPYMFDYTGLASYDVSYGLTQENSGSWLLTVNADEEWLNSSDRVYPVTIDPTLIDLRTAADFEGDTVASLTDFAVSDKTNIACGYMDVNGQMEVYFKLSNYPEIPAGSSMIRAQVGLYQNDFRSGTSGTGGEVVLYMCKNTTSAPMDSTLTWATRPAHEEVLDFVEADYYTINDVLFWDVTRAAAEWYAGETNYGLGLISNADATTKCRAWFSYNYKVTFVVSYRNTNGIESYYTYRTLGAGNAGTAYLADGTGQLTMTKQLLSYASTVNPFSLELYYNSSYANAAKADYDVGAAFGLNMNMGAGIGYNVVQRIEEVTLPTESGEDECLRYTDGDGTQHYFFHETSTDPCWYDEDGLGLKVEEYETGSYRLTDDKDNSMEFAGGILTTISDANGNQIRINYTGGKITTITQQNTGATALTLATFAYGDDGKTVSTITDASGVVYSFTYSGNRLTAITRGTEMIAQYGYTSTTATDGRMNCVHDAVAQYGVRFTYEGGRLSSYTEFAGAMSSNTTGAVVEISHAANRQTVYRSYGEDRVKNDNDILTSYSFDYAGRTVNAYTTTPSGKMISASNAVYSGIGTTDKSNNRVLRTAGSGAAAFDKQRNGGFEGSDPAWTLTMDAAEGVGIASMIKTDKPRTGNYSLKGWIRNNQSGTITASITTNRLVQGQTFTLSGYVNTSEASYFNGEGVYLRISDTAGNTWRSEAVNYKTDGNMDGGWIRVSLTFTVLVTGGHTISVVNDSVSGVFYADDVQLEEGAKLSKYNLLENGDMQYWNYGWTMGYLASFKNYMGLFGTADGCYSIQLTGDAYTESSAWQEVPVNLPASQTYVLSGWAKANSVPDNVQTAGTAEADRNKQFGLRATVTYADSQTEEHYVPFNPDVTQWQYASLAIVPKRADQTVSTIRVTLAYERNDNIAYFDNIALTREVAQTMEYDEDGNLKSVQTTGTSEETAEYANGNLLSVNTGGNGTFNYTYDTKHNLTEATNGVVKESYTVNAMGNVTNSTLTAADGSGDRITASSAYTNQGNLTSSATDARGNTTIYNYSGNFNKKTGLPSSIKDAKNVTRTALYDAYGQQTWDYISGVVGLQFFYTEQDELSSLARAGYLGTTRMEQVYNFTYDDFGNTASISVGNRSLAAYTYAAQNGMLQTITYGNGVSTSYTYDDLGRTTQVTTSSGDVYTYTYNGEGQLHEVRDNNGTTDATDDIYYRYVYDELGRLVSCVELTKDTDGDPIPSISGIYTYNTDSKLTNFSVQIPGVVDSMPETYTYNTDDTDGVSDGSLTSMSMLSGEDLTYTYDSLSRLTKREVAGILTENYSFLAGSAANTTTSMVSQYQVKDADTNALLHGYSYEYDAVGNITKITENGAGYTDYTYDTVNQLLTAKDYNTAGTLVKEYTYTYDTYGNIRTFSDGTTSHTYTYGDAEWLDLLTAYDGNTITYDTSGNPLTYHDGTTFTWRNGRQLATLTKNSQTTSYEYNLNGLRTKKTNPDGSYSIYHWMGSTLLAEEVYTSANVRSYALRFSYDELGRAVGVAIQEGTNTDWTFYYYGRNLQGDVIALYLYTTGTLVAEYDYDPWGKLLSVTDANGNTITGASHIALRNPLRYRGYYYDTDTGFYYLLSRYYDSRIGRFINADSYVRSGQSYLSYNMFAYCENNPNIHKDPCGYGIFDWIGENIVVPAKRWYEENKDDLFGTFSTGLTTSVGIGFFTFSAQIGPVIDTQGNVEFQLSVNGGFNPLADRLGYGNAQYFSVSNAPDVSSLEGMGYQMGWAGSKRIPYTPIAGTYSGEFDLYEVTDDPGTYYYGISGSAGVQIPGEDFGGPYITWGKTFSLGGFNISDLFYK